MKKLVTSAGLVAIAAAFVVGTTIAFFNDTETSSGNTLTAGEIDLKINNNSYYNGVFQGGWGIKDLANEKFFTLRDFKPGDLSQHFISWHVLNNPAWACVKVVNLQDDDNGLTEPEQSAGDQSPGPQGGGELSSAIEVLAWKDSNVNSRHDANEPFIGGTPSFFDVFTPLPFKDSTTGTGPLQPIQTEILAMSLCGGTHVVNPNTGALSCDGSAMGDTTQSDSLQADLVLLVEQERNNQNFRCVQPGP